MRSICFLVIAGSLEMRIDELKWKFTLVIKKHSCINFCYLSCLSSYLKLLNEAKEVFITSPDTCPDMTKAENLTWTKIKFCSSWVFSLGHWSVLTAYEHSFKFSLIINERELAGNDHRLRALTIIDLDLCICFSTQWMPLALSFLPGNWICSDIWSIVMQ